MGVLQTVCETKIFIGLSSTCTGSTACTCIYNQELISVSGKIVSSSPQSQTTKAVLL